jgi:hypothetical protein
MSYCSEQQARGDLKINGKEKIVLSLSAPRSHIGIEMELHS